MKSPTIRSTQKRVRDLDAVLTHAFRLPPHTLTFDNAITHYGDCTWQAGSDHHINVRILHMNQKKLLAWKTILDSLVHELAHLVHFQHKQQHRNLLIAMKYWWLRNEQ